MAWIRRSQCLMFLTLFGALLPVLQIEAHHWLWSCYLVTIFDCGMAVCYLKLYRARVSWRLLFCANFREKGGDLLQCCAGRQRDLLTLLPSVHVNTSGIIIIIIFMHSSPIFDFYFSSTLNEIALIWGHMATGYLQISQFYCYTVSDWSLLPFPILPFWVISVIGTMWGCLAFGVIASGHGWFLLPPYCPRGVELPHIRADCRLCQQLVPHVL